MNENKTVDQQLQLDIQNLSVEYRTMDGTVYAVNGIDLQIPKGKTLGLVGETGAGKSTTGLAVLKLIPNPPGVITSGTIKLGDVDIINATEQQMHAIRGKEVSMIFQDPMTSLNPVIPVGDQIEEVIAYHDKSLSKAEAKEQAMQMLEMVGITRERYGEYPHQFSGGMKQRIIIAIALACNPALLIADEPTTALDVTIQAQVLELMRDLQKQLGMAIIMITHDLGVVAQMCDEVIVMYAGSICEQGTADEIFYNPCHEYTKGLLRSIPTTTTAGTKLKPITGTPIDLLNMPKGCPFAPRCDAAMKICLTQRCERMAINDDHAAACWMNVKKGIEDGSIVLENPKEGGDAQ